MLLEHGAITVVARPRVRREEIESLDDVQRMLWVLAPADGCARRIIVVGRKRLTRRFWAFVARYVPLSPEFLAHPGAELVLIAR